MGVAPAGAPAPEGPVGALRALLGSLGQLLRIRGELATLELREEVAWRARLGILGAIAFCLLHMALLLFTLLGIVAFWDSHRLLAIGLAGAIYLALGAVTCLRIRSEIAAHPAPFAATLEELDRDLAELGRSP
jgi:uncharacterized membrane protein YqjE